MITLIIIELQKIFKKWRTYISFGAIGLLTIIVQASLYFEGQSYVNMITRGLKDQFLMTGNLLNGYLIGNMILNGLFIHIPFLIVLVGGDLLAGEATAGTYRMLITRPVSRFQIVASKFIAGNIYVFFMMAWLAALSLGLSLIIFGKGELIIFQNGLAILPANDVLWRFFCAYGVSLLSLSTVFALSFFFSSLVENAIGPIVATMAVIILFFILSALDIEFLKAIRPYLFTTHMGIWNEFFSDPVDYAEILKSAQILFAHTIVLFGAALYIFSKKDILS
jgi:ABC-2 type transport system permease protein